MSALSSISNLQDRPTETADLVRAARRATLPLDNEPPAVEPALRQIDGFIVVDELGRGGNGIVYLALDPELPRRLALKLLKDARLTTSGVERFRREAEAMARLHHAHIARVIHYACAGQTPYFTTEYFAGGSLAEHLERLRDKPRQAVEIVCQIADAVHYLHEHGLIHRDIKPQNILLDEDDSAYLGDLGLVREWSIDQTLTQAGSPVGTPGYMSPEQARGERNLSPATDIYSLGVVLRDLLTPKRSDAPSTTGSNLSSGFGSVGPQMDPTLERIILHCLEADARDRYPSAKLLADDLRAWLAGLVPPFRGPGLWRRTTKALRKHWKSASAAAAVFGAAIVLTVLLAPDPKSDLQRLQRDFDRDGHVVILDSDRRLRWHEWQVNRTELKYFDGEETRLRYEHEYGSLLEVARGLPGAGFDLDAVVRSETPEKFQVGVYVGRSEHETDRGPVQCLIGVVIEESKGQRRAAVGPLITGNRTRPSFGNLPKIADPPLPLDSGWRHLRVRLDRRFLTVFVDGKQVSETPRAELLKCAAQFGLNLKGMEALTPTFSPQDGVGLLTFNCQISIRSITITRRE